MKHKWLLPMAALVAGLGLSLYSPTSRAITISCVDLCDIGYRVCVAERGLKAGCGREFRECIRQCGLTGF